MFRVPIDPRDITKIDQNTYAHPALYPVILTEHSFICGDKRFDDLGLGSQAFLDFKTNYRKPKDPRKKLTTEERKAIFQTITDYLYKDNIEILLPYNQFSFNSATQTLWKGVNERTKGGNLNIRGYDESNLEILLEPKPGVKK